MWTWLHKFASPPHAYRLLGTLAPWFGWPALALILLATWWGLVEAPADYQQGDAFRILYVHAPSAWMSMFVYVVMAVAAAIGLIWRIKLAHAAAAASAPIGASFTFLALATGSIWGKPMWGTWWVWDARLTSELILLFLYLGYMALRSSFDDPQRADRASAVLAIVGVINVPIIHYSDDAAPAGERHQARQAVDRVRDADSAVHHDRGLPALLRLGDLAAPAWRDPAPGAQRVVAQGEYVEHEPA
jgi:heme exporter protein C